MGLMKSKEDIDDEETVFLSAEDSCDGKTQTKTEESLSNGNTDNSNEGVSSNLQTSWNILNLIQGTWSLIMSML